MNPPKHDRTRVRLIVSGRVQGVFFRASAADYARKLGLTEYARNLPDGRVEIVAEGSRASLRLLEKWAHQGTSDFLARQSRTHAHTASQSRPMGAQVDRVIAEWDDPLGEFDSFGIA